MVISRIGTAKEQTGIALDPEALSNLIGSVYEGALETIPWSGVLTWLKQHLKANWTTVVLRPASHVHPALIIEAGPHGAVVTTAEYKDHYVYALDPFAHLPLNQVFTPEEIVGAKQWFAGEFFNQFLKRDNITYMLGADFKSGDDAECRLRICRPSEAGPFSSADKAICQLLVPHFRRAVTVHTRLCMLEAESNIYAESLGEIHLGTVILDEAGEVISSNRVAEEILAEQDGLLLQQGRVYAKADSRRLNALVARAMENPLLNQPAVSEALSLPRRTGRPDLSIVVKSIPRIGRVEAKRRPAVVLFIHDPERITVPSEERLRALFHLTRAEAALARLLAEGLSLDAAGGQLGISRNTLKSRLRAIFAKTGVSRQSSLVRVLADAIAKL